MQALLMLIGLIIYGGKDRKEIYIMTTKIKYYNNPDEPKKYVELEVDEAFARNYKPFQQEQWRLQNAERAKQDYTVSLNSKRYVGGKDGDEKELQDFVACSKNPEPLSHLLARADNAEIGAALRKGFALLSPDQKRIVHLKFYQNKSDADIGEILGIGRQAVQSRVKKILDRLRKYF